MAPPLQPIRPRRRDENEYNRRLRRLILNPLMVDLRAGLSRAAAVSLFLDELRRIQWDRGLREGLVEEEVDAQAARLTGYHYNRLVQTFRTALGVDVRPILAEGEIRDYMNRWRRENIRLIRTIPARFHEALNQRVTEVFQERPFDRQALSKLLNKEFRSSGYNLRRLTRDQTSKAVGNLTQIRQTQLGIDTYKWRTSQDERVRSTHEVKDGEIFRWDQPPEDTGHPSQDVQCRCVAIAQTRFGNRPLSSLRDSVPGVSVTQP